jgi:site-specific recombinase XerC
LEFDQFLACVEKLKQNCQEAKLDSSKKPKEIAWIYQKYLICAILSSIPDRQRTLRELEYNKTLVQNSEGDWVIKHSAEDYKTGKFYGERAPLKIRQDIYPFLEEYLNIWRKELFPNHNYFFCQRNGNPPTHRNFIYNLFTMTIYKLSGKKTNPHMIRDMIVTYFKRRNASESEMESLAMYMGHSVSIQKSVYDRRSKNEKMEPAIHMMESIKLSKF